MIDDAKIIQTKRFAKNNQQTGCFVQQKLFARLVESFFLIFFPFYGNSCNFALSNN